MSLKLKLKRAFRKAHKFIIFSVVSVIICFSACFPVSALSVEFNHDNIVNDKLEFVVSNGINYSRRFLPTNVINDTAKKYSEATYWISGYSPPSGNNSTSMYFRLDEIADIHVPSGSRIRINFSVAYQGLEGYSPYITTALWSEGWNTPKRMNFGVIPYNSRLNLEFVADNTSGVTSKIDHFDINFVIYDNIKISGEFVFSWFYDSMQVVVEPIPPADPLTDPKYPETNTGAITDHNSLNNRIEDATASYRSDAVDYINFDFNSSVFSGIENGFVTWNYIITLFLDSSWWYKTLLEFSLAIGLFAFLLGLSIYAVGKIGNSNKGNRSNKGGGG